MFLWIPWPVSFFPENESWEELQTTLEKLCSGAGREKLLKFVHNGCCLRDYGILNRTRCSFHIYIKINMREMLGMLLICYCWAITVQNSSSIFTVSTLWYTNLIKFTHEWTNHEWSINPSDFMTFRSFLTNQTLLIAGSWPSKWVVKPGTIQDSFNMSDKMAHIHRRQTTQHQYGERESLGKIQECSASPLNWKEADFLYQVDPLMPIRSLIFEKLASVWPAFTSSPLRCFLPSLWVLTEAITLVPCVSF